LPGLGKCAQVSTGEDLGDAPGGRAGEALGSASLSNLHSSAFAGLRVEHPKEGLGFVAGGKLQLADGGICSGEMHLEETIGGEGDGQGSWDKAPWLGSNDLASVPDLCLGPVGPASANRILQISVVGDSCVGTTLGVRADLGKEIKTLVEVLRSV
jgi:hypothetical protein